MSAGRGGAGDELLLARDGPVLTVTFNRPEARNALTWRMYEGLSEACDAADADAGVRVLVLRGAGGQAFVAGTDIAQFETFRTAEDGLAYERRVDLHIGRLERVTKPVIALIQGVAVGAGLRIAAACDLRLATPDARFGAPIARTLGNCLSAEAYARLAELLGPARVAAVMLAARLLSAEEARAAGFVHEITPPEAAEARVRALAEEVASLAPLTLRATKEAMRRLRASRPVPDLDDLLALVYTSADFREGVRAFLDRRPPQWSGR